VDLAVDACSRLKRRLLVVGSGPEIARLKAKAGPTVEFLGRRDDAEVAGLYARCKALLFPGFEDFGITPLEAQAAGRPVIAFGRGGATETVVDQVTGVLFPEQSVEALVDAIERLDRMSIAPAACRENAMRFDVSVFRQRMSAAVDAAVLG
jgi:glycosyltransferase involved in cell wall biosynthesis